MFDLKNQLGIKSYSFRHIADNASVADAVKECGVDGVNLSACHVNYDDPDAQARIIAAYRAAGVRISGIGVVRLQPDTAHNRRFFDFAQRAGCKIIGCTFAPEGHLETLQSAEALADEYDMVLGIHNHGGKDWLGNSTILRYLLDKTTARVGVCLDTAWCLQAGDDPLKWLEMFGPRIHGVHFKDFAFSERGQWQDVVVGKGALRLPEFLGAFAALLFTGSAVVEFEGDDAVAQSRECVRAIRAALQ